MSANCVQILAAYGDWLSNNPDGEAPRPHPLFFSNIDCIGSMWPDFDEEIDGLDLQPPFFPTFGSFYIPPGWKVRLGNENNDYRTFCPADTAALVTDAHFISWQSVEPNCTLSGVAPILTNLASVFDDVFQINVASLVPFQGIPYSQTCWKFDMCNSYITSSVGTRTLTSFAQGSQECDDVMAEFCARSDGYTCRHDPDAGDNFHLPECSCLADEKDIEEAFCQPGNTNPMCANAGNFRQYIPVTCFGKTCGQQGYRFGRMLNQKCNVTLCQQLVQIQGNNLNIDAEAVLYCGSKPGLEASVTPTITPTPSPSGDTHTLETWQIILIIILAIAGVSLLAVSLSFVWQRYGNPFKKAA